MFSTSIFAGMSGFFLLLMVRNLWELGWVKLLPGLGEVPSGAVAAGKCSVVVAGRNEEARIEETVRRLQAQRGVDLEIIVVDDRSTDGTGEILKRLAEEDGRICVKRVEELPEGWLGKCHACHVGASAATGDWILFTDADCWLKPDVIERALRVAEVEEADHVTMVAGLGPGTIAQKGCHLVFLISLGGWIAGVNRDRPKASIGIGAFNLVRRRAYQECGGYEALRLTVLDDVKLGLLLRRAGKRTRAYVGGSDVECHWGRTAWDVTKILEKNYFAAVDYRTEVVVAGGLVLIAIVALILAGLWSGTGMGRAAGLAPLSLIVPALVLARRFGFSWVSALTVPLMIPWLAGAVFNSAWVTLRQGGIRWRETFYPLEQLRAGNVKSDQFF